ncbi:Protein Tamalin [Manis pentadactyla]|nr:Protein Tamalin [Manis pentadactyla]
MRHASQGQGGLRLPRRHRRAVQQQGLLLRLQHLRGALVLQASAGGRMHILKQSPLAPRHPGM